MKISIQLNSLPPKYDESIYHALEEQKLPGCFGNMVLPILDNTITIESEQVFSLRNSVPPEEIIVNDITKIADIPPEIAQTHVIDKKGYTQIESFKQDRITKYVEQALRCSACSFSDICFKLTQNYLLAIK